MVKRFMNEFSADQRVSSYHIRKMNITQGQHRIKSTTLLKRCY